MRIIQISDTHMSHLGGRASENFSVLIDYINDVLRPDLVINTGDIVVLNLDNPEDRSAAWDPVAEIQHGPGRFIDNCTRC